MAEGKIPGNNNITGQGFTNWGAYKLGNSNMGKVEIWGNVSLNADGMTFADTIPTQYRPSVDHFIVGKVYNGNDYVDCIIRIKNDGTIQINDLYAKKIDNIDLRFLSPRPIFYTLLR